MISDKWLVSPDTMDKILDKIEHMAACYDFSSKELLQIRLLCEETLAVLAPALELSKGRCRVETDSKGFSFIVTCIADPQGLTDATREKLLGMDKGKRKGGIFGAIGKALDVLFVPDYYSSGSFDAQFVNSMSYHDVVVPHYVWRAEQDGFALSSQKSGTEVSKREDDDGLEISIVEKYADDIRAMVKPGGKLEITVTKHYSKQPEGVEFA